MKVLSILNKSLIDEQQKLEFLLNCLKSIKPEQRDNFQKEILEVIDTIEDIHNCIKLINKDIK